MNRNNLDNYIISKFKGEPEEWKETKNDLRSERLTDRNSPEMKNRQQRFHNFEDDIREAFQRHRNFVMDSDYYVTYRAYEVGRCLDECLRDRDM